VFVASLVEIHDFEKCAELLGTVVLRSELILDFSDILDRLRFHVKSTHGNAIAFCSHESISRRYECDVECNRHVRDKETEH
jgi:hypothetical protein